MLSTVPIFVAFLAFYILSNHCIDGSKEVNENDQTLAVFFLSCHWDRICSLLEVCSSVDSSLVILLKVDWTRSNSAKLGLMGEIISSVSEPLPLIALLILVCSLDCCFFLILR